jgi:hypothetical protein
MSAHSRTPNISVSVAPSQPQQHWWSWLQRIAEGLNEVVAWINRQTSSGTFADLPQAPTVGATMVVTDSNIATWGGVVAGGGANTVLAWWNGTAWKVIG